ncbi:MAG: 50S ribosomal protein L17 [Bacilli bacterium]
MSLGYRRLGRNSSQRKALLRDLVTDLIINNQIETTYHKAKELQRLADRMVTLGKAGDLAARRKAAQMIRFEKADENQFAIQKLFSEIAPKYANRKGGYTRVLRAGVRRGDAAEMAVIMFVEE